MPARTPGSDGHLRHQLAHRCRGIDPVLDDESASGGDGLVDVNRQPFPAERNDRSPRKISATIFRYWADPLTPYSREARDRLPVTRLHVALCESSFWSSLDTRSQMANPA